MHINRTNFWSRNNYFWKVSIWHIIQNHWKKLALLWTLQFQFNHETYPTRNFRLSNWLWTPNAYRIVVQKIFLLQMLRETSIFTLPGKVPYWQKCQNDVLRGNANMNVSPYILRFKFFFKYTCSTMAAWIHFGVYCRQKVKWYFFSKRFV